MDSLLLLSHFQQNSSEHNMEAAQLPADALPPGWSSGGAGARDPESAQRQAQQVGRVFRDQGRTLSLTGKFKYKSAIERHFWLNWCVYPEYHLLYAAHSLQAVPQCGRSPPCTLPLSIWRRHSTPSSIVLHFHRNTNKQQRWRTGKNMCGASVG